MATHIRSAGWLVAALTLWLPAVAVAQAQPAPAASSVQAQQQSTAQQPGNNAPVWREVRSGADNYTSIPGRETGVLIQPQARFPGQDARSTAGEAWRNFRNGPITFYGGWVFVIAILAIGAFYFAKGPIRLHEPPTGRLIERFNSVERWAHWTVAISFCILALTGLNILFGKYVLLPILGYTLFAWLSTAAKLAHNFVAPVFIAGLVALIAVFIKDNVYQKGDFAWLASGWKMFTRGQHVPSWRFNMGEKMYFWIGVVGLCIALSVTGVVMLFPNFDQVRTTMQQMNVIHSVSGMVMMLFALGHIYVGTIGVEGAYRNMRDGVTDEAWAKEHHELWYNEVKSGKADAASGAAPQAQH